MVPYWRLSGFYFCYFALLGGVAPFLSLYFHYLGFSAARIGELIAIPMLMRCIAPNLWGWLGDRSGRRLEIVRLGAFCTAITFSAILWRQDYLRLALIMALHSFFWHAILPQFETITLSHLAERSARYSRIRLWGSVGFIVTVTGLGMLLGWTAQHLPLLTLAQVLHAATFGCFHVAAVHFVQQHFSARLQGQGQALYATLSGCGGALGALYAGYSWSALGAGLTTGRWTIVVKV